MTITTIYCRPTLLVYTPLPSPPRYDSSGIWELVIYSPSLIATLPYPTAGITITESIVTQLNSTQQKDVHVYFLWICGSSAGEGGCFPGEEEGVVFRRRRGEVAYPLCVAPALPTHTVGKYIDMLL